MNAASISRRSFLKIIGIAIALPSLASAVNAAESTNTPNIVFILADDLGQHQLGCYGSTFYETPNIDRLAREGMRFTNAYAASPVCSPTRASIVTGKYPARLHLANVIGHGSGKLLTPKWTKHLPLEEGTIAKSLKTGGYATGYIGKWHLFHTPDKQGFDYSFVTYKPKYWTNPENDAHNIRMITKKSLEFIEENRENTFFLVCFT